MRDTTVEDGTLSNTAIERCPARPASASNAAPSTVTASAGRSNTLAGSRTCVRPQPRQPTTGCTAMHQDGPSVSARTCRRAVDYLRTSSLTLTSHTTNSKTPTDRPQTTSGINPR